MRRLLARRRGLEVKREGNIRFIVQRRQVASLLLLGSSSDEERKMSLRHVRRTPLRLDGTGQIAFAFVIDGQAQ